MQYFHSLSSRRKQMIVLIDLEKDPALKKSYNHDRSTQVISISIRRFQTS